jgi:Zn finger protein HypA/HybF involved in hydrogenase expression
MNSEDYLLSLERDAAGVCMCADCERVEVEERDAICADCRLERRNVKRGHAGEWVYVYDTSSQEDDFNVY